VNQNIVLFSKKYNPRFVILTGLESEVKTIKAFRKLMQYNGYKQHNKDFPNDPSFNDPAAGISARGDLRSPPNYSGGIDLKIVDANMVLNMEIYTKMGPSTDDNPNLTPFNLNNHPEMNDYSNGTPKIFNFEAFVFKDVQDS